MVYVYEFEVFKGEKYLLAFPYDMDGGTQGVDFKEVCEMAGDWLKMEVEHCLMYDLPMPEATFGNKPKHADGQNIIVVVQLEKENIPRYTFAEAARQLGVTRGRVSQMVDACLLETFELDGRKWVTKYSVDARLAERPKAGRPRKKKSEDEFEEPAALTA